MNDLLSMFEKVYVDFKSIYPRQNPGIFKMYDQLKNKEKILLVEKYELFWHRIIIVNNFLERLNECAKIKLDIDQRFGKTLSSDSYDLCKFIIYPFIEQTLYSLVKLFENPENPKKYEEEYPELYYCVYLRNSMIEHPSLEYPFTPSCGSVYLSQSPFELSKKHYSSLITDKNFVKMEDEKKRQENKDYFKNGKKDWMKDCFDNKEAMYKLKCISWTNVDYNKAAKEFRCFYEQMIKPFIIPKIKKAESENIIIPKIKKAESENII